METTVTSENATTFKFWWKVDSLEYSGYLQFFIDSNEIPEDYITGEVDWTEKTYNLSSGTHTLKWRYVNDSNDVEETENCGWVDYIQWSGASSPPPRA